jgi:hypothetical protein
MKRETGQVAVSTVSESFIKWIFADDRKLQLVIYSILLDIGAVSDYRLLIIVSDLKSA